MGRTKKTPVVWQDFHDEGAFRSTLTSQANPGLFNGAVDKTSHVGHKHPAKGKGPDRHEPGGDKVKKEDSVPPERPGKGIKRENGGLPGTVVSSH